MNVNFSEKKYRKLKRQYKHNRSNALKQELYEAEQQYKKTLDSSIQKHRENMQQRDEKLTFTQTQNNIGKILIEAKRQNNLTFQ